MFTTFVLIPASNLEWTIFFPFKGKSLGVELILKLDLMFDPSLDLMYSLVGFCLISLKIYSEGTSFRQVFKDTAALIFSEKTLLM